MTTYVALLRGINVGGKNMVSMKALKTSFEQLGFKDVATYINSGNILFKSGIADPRKLESRIDRMLTEDYGLKGRTVVRSTAEMARLVKKIDATWEVTPDWRYNVIFLRHTIDSKEVLETFPQQQLEKVVYCPGTVLWCARASDLRQTSLQKLSSKPVFQNMTVRNLNTTRKLLALMQAMD